MFFDEIRGSVLVASEGICGLYCLSLGIQTYVCMGGQDTEVAYFPAGQNVGGRKYICGMRPQALDV